MTWRGPELMLLPLLLVLLASGRTCCPGSRVSAAVPKELHAVVGQTLSVRCQYTPQTGPYLRKSWCCQTEEKRCSRVVTTSQPWTTVEELRYTIWDDPHAGFFVINMSDLKEDNSGKYWCGNYNVSINTIFILRNITLVVSPGETSLGKPLVASPEGTPGLSINGSEHSNSSGPFPPDAASPELLFLLQGGLLAVKGLLLSALCTVLCCRDLASFHLPQPDTRIPAFA
ncbi:trem-like transcript 4 protein [Heterocephalus glaber]|uniref:Trem-like transcript 4 protein n=1 Tax=Heterocephalus glaber TaxID=10181 RepID=A0AAX6T0X6_HETGA|nr:trem-like transcript 4 protein [Heterocephalus glaber]